MRALHTFPVVTFPRRRAYICTEREKLFACVFECIKKGFYTKCHYWLRISVHLTNGFRVSVLEPYSVDINSVTADSRFPLSADGAMPVAYVCAIFSLRRLWPASLPPCRTLPCVGRRWPRAPVSWAAAVAWRGSHGTGLWPVVGRGRGGRWGARHWLEHTGSLKERCWGEVLCVWSRDLREPVYSGRGGGGSWPAAQECLCHDGSGGEEECAPQSQHCRSRATAEVAAISSYLF